MQVNHERAGSELVVRLTGELDHHEADMARETIDELLSDRKVKTLVLDMSGVGFMDSSGVGVVLGRYRTMAHRGGRMYIRSPGARVDRILEMSGIYRVVERV